MSLLHDTLAWFFGAFQAPILVYFFAINTSYLVLVVMAALDFAGYLRRRPFAGLDDAAASPLTQPVTVVVPAFNEEAGIVPSVRAMLALRYPEHEVVVVDDGSTDATFERLREAFDLVEVPRAVPADVPLREEVHTVFKPADGRTCLVVARTRNSGKSDSINAGINVARYPLVLIIDADSILDPEALLVVSKPFADDPARTVASGGVVRPANGCRVVAGRVVDVRMPRGWLARIQVVEYLRAFLLGRTGWSRARALVLISGAFGLFRRDVLVEAGGLDPDCIGEDFELVTRIHKLLRDRGADYRVCFVAEPVCWTEVPPGIRVLARQRRRWQRGLWQVLWSYRGMLFRPRYGRIGSVALPNFWLFELLAPVLEAVGVVVVPLGLAFGLVSWTYAAQFLLAAYGYALLVSLAALCVEEFSFHRYSRWRDLWVSVLACVGENLGYRQLTAFWRLQGLWVALRGRRVEWGRMTRVGFGAEAEVRRPTTVGSAR